MSSRLDQIVSEVREYWGLQRKQPIGRLVTILQKEGFQCPHVLSSVGEDSAAIDLGGENLILLTTDAVIPELAKSNPHVAGYAAILVNVNDIYAAGGHPIVAMVNIAFNTMDAGIKFMQGICEAGRKFRVEIVRGHTNPDGPVNSVSASICGIVGRDAYISAGGAKDGDKLILAIDLEGRQSPNYPHGWDTTTLKTSEQVMKRYEAMRELGKRKLLNASKDLSNGGIIGTTLLMLEYSRRGSIFDLANIPRPQDITLIDWLKMYITTGYIVSAPSKNVQSVLDIFEEHKFAASVVGSINNSRKLVLQLNQENREVFDFTRETIVAPPKPPKLTRLKL